MEGSRTKNASRNAVAGIFNRIVIILIPFVLRTAIIKVLGEEYLGLNNLFSSVLQVLSLADLGFHAAIVYNMYRPIAEQDTAKICALLNLYRKIYVTIGLIILAVGLMLIPFLDKLVSGDYPEGLNITILYLMYLANTVSGYMFFAYRKSLLSAHQRSDLVNNINALAHITFDLIKLILLFLWKNYYVYIMFLPITTFVGDMVTAIISYKKYPQYRCIGNVDKDTKTDIIKRVSALTIQRFGNTISLSLDNIVVSVCMGLTAVAVYGNYFYIVSSLMSFIYVCIGATTSGVGNSLVTETKERNFFIFKKINMLNQWAIVWCVPCLVCLYQHFMYMWVGTDLMMDMSFVWLMVVYFYIGQSRKVVQVFKDAAGMWWADRWRPLAGCAVNLVLNIISVKYIGMHGVILSTIVSYLFVEVPWETLVFFKQCFKGQLMAYMLDMFKYLVCIFMATIASVLICSFVDSVNILTFIVKGVLCFVISNCIFVLAFRKRTEFAELSGIVKGMLRL